MAKYRVVAGGLTDIGQRRKNNEDYFCLEEKTGLFIVADGVGGSASGEIASKMAADIIRDYINSDSNEEDIQAYEFYRPDYSLMTNKLSMALMFANESIYKLANEQAKLKGMATTTVAGVINNERLSVAHVGDSRLYLIRDNYIEQLTEDHSLVAEQIRRGLVDEESAKDSGMTNVITRSLGYVESVEVEMNELFLYDGDIILLCSDGLHSMVTDNVMYQTVRSTKNPADACQRLVHFANKKGGKDNITVIVAYIYKKRWFSFIFNLFK
ncbi:MAG: Stp1/IreP family PP2C-type Ser/Thr phosphatase [Candidatus Magnetoovum sp. WYHC-5]|nr:Stp1/IreP family PP2C-type Ser/Thr phosphatase [Candidatus Magnetoovum sp. WYHC-5]